MSDSVCELCGNESEIGFNYALPGGVEFEPSISESPTLFQAMVCFECMSSVASDGELVLKIARKRKAALAQQEEDNER